jgi:hypothetical protein
MFTKFDRAKIGRGIDLIGERLPLGVLWFEGLNAIKDAVNYARSSHTRIPRLFAYWMNPGRSR